MLIISPSTTAECLTLSDAFKRYVDDYAKHQCRTTRKMILGFNLYFPALSHYRLDEIKTSMVRQWHLHLSNTIGLHTANRQLSLLKAVYNCMMEWELYDGRNPGNGVKKFKEHARTRFLSALEVNQILEVLPQMSELFADYVRLSIFTGQRQANVLQMKWSEVDLETKLWIIPRTKNGDSHIVPLISDAIELLKRRKGSSRGIYVLPSDKEGYKYYVWPTESWNRLRKLTGLNDIRMHDLRRTLGSWQAITGSEVPVIAATLGHKSWASTQVYARLNLDPVRSSMQTAVNAMQAV